MPENVLVSFSGGRTSAYMTRRYLEENPDKNIVVVFANTGQEDSKTLEFVNNCDKHFGFNTVWIEAEVSHGYRKGTKHKQVTFESASREGRPYEDVVSKYGIPNKIAPFCTRELKQRPIISFARSIGWGPKDYKTAIGIRIDEIDRMNPRADEVGIFYPLVKWGIDKKQILSWWKDQPFDLQIPEHRGNCLWCWKKSNRKLFTLAKEDKSIFNFPDYLENKYGMHGSLPKKNGKPMKFFRGDKSTKELIQEAFTTDFKEFVDENYLDQTNGCEDSCEVFATEEDIEDILKA